MGKRLACKRRHSFVVGGVPDPNARFVRALNRNDIPSFAVNAHADITVQVVRYACHITAGDRDIEELAAVGYVVYGVDQKTRIVMERRKGFDALAFLDNFAFGSRHGVEHYDRPELSPVQFTFYVKDAASVRRIPGLPDD